jgi:uncharacterized protein (TIGR03435 family)
MAGFNVREPSRLRKALLSVAGVSVGVFMSFGFVTQIRAQSPNANQGYSIADTWQGTLHEGRDLRAVIKISKTDDGGYQAVLYSLDQTGGDGYSSSKVALEGSTLKMFFSFGTYDGKLSSDGKNITGTFVEPTSRTPLTLARSTPETEWTIPPPAPRPRSMDANANPSFEVATIKPSLLALPGKNAGFSGGRYRSRNTNVNDLIALAYGLHAKQIVDGPGWFGTDLYDIEGKPDAEGVPSDKQIKIMLQRLLVERFKLTFHHEKRDLSVYVISVAGGGPKMTKSTSDRNALSSFGFRGLGHLVIRNMTMTDFATWMQAGVTDRPVVDKTELSDRYDFQLDWTPDESQFAQFRGVGRVVPPPTNDLNALPSLYAAMQEQLGLKLNSTKNPVEVMVIDHVEKPSPN